MGLKSVECVRLLTLHHLAFPVSLNSVINVFNLHDKFADVVGICKLYKVDTNVGRIAVRLGWVPLRPLPESLQLHLLELSVSQHL